MKEGIAIQLETVLPSDSLDAAIHRMKTFAYRHLPVFEDGKVLGMVSSLDIERGKVLAKLHPEKEILVDDIMCKNTICIDRYSNLQDAVTMMIDHQIRALVVTELGVPVGIITEVDLFKALRLLLIDRSLAVDTVLNRHGIIKKDLKWTVEILRQKV